MSDAPNMPCAILRLKRVVRAYSSSTCTGLKSPVSSANALMSSSVIVFEASALSPIFRVIRESPGDSILLGVEAPQHLAEIARDHVALELQRRRHFVRLDAEVALQDDELLDRLARRDAAVGRLDDFGDERAHLFASRQHREVFVLDAAGASVLFGLRGVERDERDEVAAPLAMHVSLADEVMLLY